MGYTFICVDLNLRQFEWNHVHGRPNCGYRSKRRSISGSVWVPSSTVTYTNTSSNVGGKWLWMYKVLYVLFLHKIKSSIINKNNNCIIVLPGFDIAPFPWRFFTYKLPELRTVVSIRCECDWTSFFALEVTQHREAYKGPLDFAHHLSDLLHFPRVGPCYCYSFGHR
jgi:hypothetical protein